MMTVLGAFQGSGGGSTGTDFTHGGTMQGSLTITGGLTVQNSLTVQSGLGVVGTIGAAAANFGELYIQGEAVDLSNLASGSGGSTTSAPQEWQPLEDTDAIRNGGRYFVRGASGCAVELANYPVCKYAQAEIALVSTCSALDIGWPSYWLWPVGSTYNKSDCETDITPRLNSYTAQVLRVRHDGKNILANIEYGYNLDLWDNPLE